MSASAARSAFGEDRISDRNFNRLASFIYDYSGIKMPPGKRTMLEGRLRRRLRVTGHGTFDDYCEYLFKEDGLESETIYLIDAVTTNKTDFFREPNHFEYLVRHVLPTYDQVFGPKLRVWSSACSTGAEPYTIAMLLEEHIEPALNSHYRILATDLSTEVLETARKGIYPRDMVAPVPPALRQKYALQHVDPSRPEIRIHPKLRSRVGFARLNLMDEEYRVGDPMQIIFCRNVMIYFDKPTQQRVLTRLCNNLVSGGYLFIGHSETVSGFDLPIKQVANTIFRKV
ncbi:chemotaxis protein methyltransferase CheR [Rhizobium sp. RU36D]|nr:chemotaxis protein methyltransferase CheR [Rhizobium sp. RU36D]